MKSPGSVRRSVFVTLMALGTSALVWAAAPPAGRAPAQPPRVTLPRMVDLGAGKCIPCKKMAPIIEEMRADYATIVDIEFLDVWKDPKAGTPYRIRLIPTQVFFDRAGLEVYRHEGFMPREEIEKIFQDKLGVTPIKPAAKAPKSGAGADLLPGRNARG